MQEITLEVSVRDTTKKGDIKRLRNAGKLPSVIYGRGEKNILAFVEKKSFKKIIQQTLSGNVIFNLKIGDTVKKAIIKDIQRDIVKRVPIHVDFQVVSMESKIEVLVPVKLIGDAPGVKLHGGILEHFVREIKVKCLPKDIPESIEVDISKLDIGKGIVVGELPKLPGVEYLIDPRTMVVNVVAPKKEEVVTSLEGVAAATPTEPEVISKGKKEAAEELAEEKPKKQ